MGVGLDRASSGRAQVWGAGLGYILGTDSTPKGIVRTLNDPCVAPVPKEPSVWGCDPCQSRPRMVKGPGCWVQNTQSSF